jgi:hypothetical protein
VRKILVIENVGLWIALNRHLSGVDSVELIETTTTEMGTILAQIERPDIVVCSGISAGSGPRGLLRELRKRGLDDIHVVCVDDGDGGGDPGSQAAAGLSVCDSEHFVSVVTELLELSEEKPEQGVELLAHYEIRSDSQGAPRRGFAILFELNERHLLLESDIPLDTGGELLLSFFLSPAGAERTKISLTCIISHCRDDKLLRYSARVSKIEQGTKTELQRFAAEATGRTAR